MRNVRRRHSIFAVAAASALLLAACGDESAETPESGNGTDETGAEGDGDAAADEIVIGVHAGWDEGIAASYLWKHILEEEGYTVTLETADAGVVYTAIDSGDFDLNLDAWLPYTHASYQEQYGDGWEMLGVWNDEAALTIAVNEDAPITSLDELADNADAFGNRLVGIEAGAGLTEITQNEVIPTYGLEGMEYLTSSTPAMLAELSAATSQGENVVVTLWRPHWAYDEFPIRDLEDPEGALGEAEEINSIGRTGFTEDFPEVAEWLGNFTLTSDELHELENIMFNENEGEDNEGSIEQWLELNPDYVERIIG